MEDADKEENVESRKVSYMSQKGVKNEKIPDRSPKRAKTQELLDSLVMLRISGR